jgi:zinc protease
VTLKNENVHQPEFVRLYSAPSVGEADKALVVPSFVLSQIMSGGETGRLYQSLVVRQKLAVSVDTDYDGIRVGPGAFEIHAIPADGVTLPQLEAAIDKEIAIMRDEAPNDGELSRAKILIKAETIYARDGLEGLAQTLGTLVMEGLGPDYFTRWPTLIEQVTAADVRMSAQAIFTADASVTGYLLPSDAARPLAQEAK